MSESNVLANLGVKGVADTGGTADHEGFLLRADATGKIDTSWLGAVLLSPLYATYWVDDTNGDDATGNGTAGAPYKTITKAVAVNLAGTPSEMVVILSPGVYAAPELTHADQDHIVFSGSDPNIVELTGNVKMNNGNGGFNRVTLVGVTADIVEDVTTTSTFEVAMLARAVVDTIRYVIGVPGEYGTVYQMPGTSLINSPPTNLALVTATATMQLNKVPVGVQNGINTLFTLPSAHAYIPNKLVVYLNGIMYGPTDILENGPGYTTFDVVGGVLPDAGAGDVFTISYFTYAA